jgi:hypothetical protein
MPQSQRDTSLAQLGAAAEAFAIEPAGGAGTVETARRVGVQILSGRDEVVQGPPDSHGNEHDIWFREMAGEARVIKITRGKHALYGISDGPASYLRRWLNSNRLFGDDIRLVGVLPDGRFVISQLFVAGAMPTTLEMHKALSACGWRQYRNSGTVWTSPDGRIVMSEVHNGNFIHQPDGTMSAIDVALHSGEEWESQLNADEFAEAYGEDYKPPTLSQLLDAVGGDLTAFGFLE